MSRDNPKQQDIGNMTDELKQLMQSALASYEAAGVDGSEGARAMRESLARIQALEAALLVADDLADAVSRESDNFGIPAYMEDALAAYRKATGAEQ